VQAAFANRPSDHAPIYLGSISSRIASRVLGRDAHVGGGMQQYREALALWMGGGAHDDFLERSRADALELGERLDLDYVRPLYWRYNVMPDARPDEYTFVYGDLGGRHKVMRFFPNDELYCVVSQSDERAPQDPDELEPIVEQMEAELGEYQPSPIQYADLKSAVEHFKGKRAVSGIGVSHTLPAYDPIWLMAIKLRPDLAERYLNASLGYTLRNIEILRGVGTPYLHGGGDFSGNAGPFFSPADFERLVLPGLQKISAACEQYGLHHMFASDGNLWPVADALFGRSGIHAYYEIDRDCGMDLRRLRREYPRLTLLGGISSATLHTGSAADAAWEARDAIESAKEYGGIIVGCSNMVVAPTPYENFMAMMESLHKNK